MDTPCLPTHHPRSQPPSPSSPTPTPTRCDQSTRGTCSPTSPPSPTPDRPVVGGTRLLDRCAGLPWPRTGPHPRPCARPRRAAHPQGGLGPPLRVPARRPDPPGHPQVPRPSDPAMADGDRLHNHQPHLRPGQPRPARRPPPGALRTAYTTSATSPSPRTPPSCAPGPARRSWPACAPRHRRPQPRRAGQPRRRPTPPRPRPTPTPGHPRHHPRMKPGTPQARRSLALALREGIGWRARALTSTLVLSLIVHP